MHVDTGKDRVCLNQPKAHSYVYQIPIKSRIIIRNLLI